MNMKEQTLNVDQVVTWHNGQKYPFTEIIKHDPPVRAVIRNKKGLYEISKQYGVELESGTEITRLEKELFDWVRPLCWAGVEFKNCL